MAVLRLRHLISYPPMSVVTSVKRTRLLLLWNIRIFSLFPSSLLFLSLTQGSCGVAQADLELEFTEDDLEPLVLLVLLPSSP